MTQQQKRTNRFVDEVRLAATMTPAVPKVVPVSRTTATADSSGFVDLSDFSDTDGDWVERALVQSRNGGRVVPPSIAPVAMEALAQPEVKPPANAALGAIAFVAVCVAVAAVGIAAAALVLRARSERAETATAQIAAMSFTLPSAEATVAAAPSSDAPPVAAAAAPSDSAPSTVAARPSRKPASKATWASPQPQSTHAAAPPRAAAAAPKRAASSGGGGGSLDDLIRRAAQSKGGH